MAEDLFSRSTLLEHAANQKRDALRQVAQADEDRITDDPVGFAEDLISRHTLQRVTINLAGVERSEPRQDAETVYAGGVPSRRRFWAVKLFVPFSGSPAALTLKASEYLPTGLPQGEVYGSTLELEVVSEEPDAAAINREAHRQLDLVQRLVGFANADIDIAFRDLDAAVREAVHDRNQTIKQRNELSQGLEFPVRKSLPRSTSRNW